MANRLKRVNLTGVNKNQNFNLIKKIMLKKCIDRLIRPCIVYRRLVHI